MPSTLIPVRIVPVLPLATYTSNPTPGTEYPAFFASHGYTGIRILVDLNANASTSLTFTLQGYDPVSTDLYTLLASAAKTSDAHFELLYGPGVITTANVAAPGILPAFWQVSVSGTDDDAAYVITAELYAA